MKHKQPEISKESVYSAREKRPKRICFGSKHDTALKKNKPDSDFAGAFNVPFGEGFQNIFPWPLKPNENDLHHTESYWRSIKSQEEYEAIEAWIKERKDFVFLRDCLCASMALSLNMSEPGQHTQIGQYEHDAKTDENEGSISTLAALTVNAIQNNTIYKGADCICAVPSHASKPFDLPKTVVAKIAHTLGKKDLTGRFTLKNAKPRLRNTSFDEKWNAWEKAELTFDANISGKTVILIDDKYQSGITIQYVASKLQHAGAREIYGLCFVKTLRDDDNQ